MKKIYLLLFLFSAGIFRIQAQCTITPNASTFIMSLSTVGSNYTLNSNNTYPLSRAFYICQGTTVTIQNRPGADTFYVSAGATLIGTEPNSFRIFVKGSGTYDATNSNIGTIYYETGAIIQNFTGPMLPPCPMLTIDMSLIGANACNPTTSVTSLTDDDRIVVFPNPSQDKIYVSAEGIHDGKILVYDLSGKLVFTGLLNSELGIFDISELEKGIYMMRIICGKETSVKKIVKE